ncbi:MAG TPA: hypothetical protein VEL74_12265, partial [Thermoanaerobaculia bacterium]|nr:hypothetical protein [Thermoanaerobaculia bacterium]
ETVLNASLALARKARELTGLGTVEVVVADPEPRVALAATGEAQALSDALGAIAAQARQDGSRAAKANKAGGSVAPETAALRRQLDRLVTLVADRPRTGAGALFLVMDAFVPPPGEADLLSTALADDPGPPGTATAALRETARVLAARGLVTFAVPMREPQERKRVEVNDTERIRVMSGPSRHTTGVPPVIPMGGTGRGPLRHEPVVDVLTRPDSAPLMTLVQPTAGTVLGVEEQLGPALQGLAGRWRVWFQAPEIPDGSLRRVEVRLPSSKVPLRGPRWVMASTPEGLAAARARLLAGGTSMTGGAVPVEARLEGKELRLRLPALPATAAAPAGPVRISVAFDNRSEVKHTVVPEADLGKAWQTTLRIQPPTGARKAAVVVEDLARGRWGATALDLTAAPAAQPGG